MPHLTGIFFAAAVIVLLLSLIPTMMDGPDWLERAMWALAILLACGAVGNFAIDTARQPQVCM